MKWLKQVRSFVRDQEAQDLIEYALLVGLVSLVAVAALGLTGTSVSDIFNAIHKALVSATPAS
jgi:Flp pilus assembly pilin Flp